MAGLFEVREIHGFSTLTEVDASSAFRAPGAAPRRAAVFLERRWISGRQEPQPVPARVARPTSVDAPRAGRLSRSAISFAPTSWQTQIVRLSAAAAGRTRGEQVAQSLRSSEVEILAKMIARRFDRLVRNEQQAQRAPIHEAPGGGRRPCGGRSTRTISTPSSRSTAEEARAHSLRSLRGAAAPASSIRQPKDAFAPAPNIPRR